jgi:hypothetical protein
MELVVWPDLVGPWPSSCPDESRIDDMAVLAQGEAEPLAPEGAARERSLGRLPTHPEGGLFAFGGWQWASRAIAPPAK